MLGCHFVLNGEIVGVARVPSSSAGRAGGSAGAGEEGCGRGKGVKGEEQRGEQCRWEHSHLIETKDVIGLERR